MSTKYVRVVPSSDGAGASLSSEIEHAFERIRERAYAIYDNRMADASNNEYENWLQAERELFEVPEIFVKDEGMSCRIHLETEAGADRQLTIIVEPSLLTVLGHRTADGEMILFRRANLPEPVDPERAESVVRRGSGIEMVIAKRGAPVAEKLKARAAAVGQEVVGVV